MSREALGSSAERCTTAHLRSFVLRLVVLRVEGEVALAHGERCVRARERVEMELGEGRGAGGAGSAVLGPVDQSQPRSLGRHVQI